GSEMFIADGVESGGARISARRHPCRWPPGNSDVCALGHKYGGWGKDTPQAAICRDVYGR
ncbi:hypothetical protein PV406_27155, partial [Streptomyces scabiei]|nr:hypothetical protein [Streptomyces scabiei]